MPSDPPELGAVLDEVERVVLWSDGFTLAFIISNSPAQREAIRRELHARLDGTHVLELDLPGPIASLLDAIKDRWTAGEPPRAVFVHGLERSLEARRERSPILGRLNHDRDLLRRQVPVPVLIWLPDFAVDLMARHAPDFWAWRSGVYELPDESLVRLNLSRSEISSDLDSLQWLGVEEKQQEIRRLEQHLQSERESLGPERDGQALFGRMLRRLGRLQQSVGEFDRALECYREAVGAFEKAEDPRLRAIAWGDVADILIHRGQLDEALRIRREEELPVYERLGDVRSRAVTQGKIADILFVRGQFDEALRIRRQEELPVYELLGDVRERAITQGKIADILFACGQLDEALRIRREEQLPVFERLGDVRSRAVALGNVSDIHQARGQLDEALRIRREEELPIYERLGDVRERAVTQGKIANILFARGQLDEALRILREEELPVYERLGDVRSRAVALGNVSDILFQKGERDGAIRMRTEEQLPIFEKLGDVQSLIVNRVLVAQMLLMRGREEDIPQAHEWLVWSWREAKKHGLRETGQIEELFRRIGLPLPREQSGEAGEAGKE